MQYKNQSKKRTDANQIEIVNHFLSLGCKVQDLSQVGGGCFDLLVGIPTPTGLILKFVEVKSMEGKLNPGQKLFAKEWTGANHLVRTIKDVDCLVRSYNQEAKL